MQELNDRLRPAGNLDLPTSHDVAGTMTRQPTEL